MNGKTYWARKNLVKMGQTANTVTQVYLKIYNYLPSGPINMKIKTLEVNLSQALIAVKRV